MSELPELIGSEAQVQWAYSIRQQALHGGQMWTVDQAALLWKIQDSTGWIANRQALPLGSFKPPSEAQLVGAETGDDKRSPAAVVRQVSGFAESVSQHTALAEITILALMGKLYKGETGDRLRQRAAERLDRWRAEQVEMLERDMQAIERILGRK